MSYIQYETVKAQRVKGLKYLVQYFFAADSSSLFISKPLVCADFRPHPHAHRTQFGSVRRTHPHPSFCARTRTRTRTFLPKKNFQKKNLLAKNEHFFQKKNPKIFFSVKIEVRTCARTFAP